MPNSVYFELFQASRACSCISGTWEWRGVWSIGGMILTGGRNRSTERKTCHSTTLSTKKSHTDAPVEGNNLGHVVTQLVEALRYKPEGRGFDSRWCHCDFSLTYYFRAHYGTGVLGGGGKDGWWLGLKNLPPTCTDSTSLEHYVPVEACNSFTLLWGSNCTAESDRNTQILYADKNIRSFVQHPLRFKDTAGFCVLPYISMLESDEGFIKTRNMEHVLGNKRCF